MARHVTRLILRRLGMRVSILFGLFVLADVALFGWLILSSMSQREIERVLLETREDAEPLARELKELAERIGQEDLYVVLSVAEETRSDIASMLRERASMDKLKIRDREGRMVYQFSQPGEDVLETSKVDLGTLGREIEIPIGEIGFVVIGVSEEELQRRIAELRSDLVSGVSIVAVFTATLLGVALAAILLLFRRADQLEEQALEAERMAYVGTLASGLAHEIRNPLNSLNLNMQMLEEEARSRRPGDSSRRILSITRSEISRLEHLVTDFLSYARPRPLRLVETTAAALFEPLLELMEGEIKARGVEVSVEDKSGGARIAADPDQMSQLLLNLEQNALAAVAETGRAGRIVLAAERQAGQVLLSIADNGPGVPEPERSQIFDLFYSTKKGGTGLGLAIVERIAKSHGAELEVGSVPGEGTTVRLRLPARG